MQLNMAIRIPHRDTCDVTRCRVLARTGTARSAVCAALDRELEGMERARAAADALRPRPRARRVLPRWLPAAHAARVSRVRHARTAVVPGYSRAGPAAPADGHFPPIARGTLGGGRVGASAGDGSATSRLSIELPFTEMSGDGEPRSTTACASIADVLTQLVAGPSPRGSPSARPGPRGRDLTRRAPCGWPAAGRGRRTPRRRRT